MICWFPLLTVSSLWLIIRPMLLMIDNYDSFTYNLVQYLGELGQEVCVHRNDQITVDEIATLGPDYIVISPGPCTPTEAGVSVDVVQAFATSIPILGVCLGSELCWEGFWLDGMFQVNL